MAFLKLVEIEGASGGDVSSSQTVSSAAIKIATGAAFTRNGCIRKSDPPKRCALRTPAPRPRALFWLAARGLRLVELIRELIHAGNVMSGPG